MESPQLLCQSQDKENMDPLDPMGSPSKSDTRKAASHSPASLNQEILAAIQLLLSGDATANILSVIPSDYMRRLKRARLRAICSDTETSDSETKPRKRQRQLMISDMRLVPKPKKPKLAKPLPDKARKGRLGDSSNPKVLRPGYGPGARQPEPLEKMIKICRNMFGPVRSNVQIIEPLSSTVRDLMSYSGDEPELLARAVRDVFERGELLFQLMGTAVVKCSDKIVAKCVTDESEINRLTKEMASLQYLEMHVPEVPAPRVHGMISMGWLRVLYVTYFPDQTLEKAWPLLTQVQKQSVQAQLETIMQALRKHKQAPGLAFGPVDGSAILEFRFMDGPEAPGPISTEEELDDFTFAQYPQASPNYIEAFRRLLPVSNAGSVMTHGDFRPANIMVDLRNGECCVTGVIDWEQAGFFPEYYEANRAANLMLPDWKSDWYLFLPPCISPAASPVRWLFDRLWDYHMRHHMIYVCYLDANGKPCHGPKSEPEAPNKQDEAKEISSTVVAGDDKQDVVKQVLAD